MVPVLFCSFYMKCSLVSEKTVGNYISIVSEYEGCRTPMLTPVGFERQALCQMAEMTMRHGYGEWIKCTCICSLTCQHINAGYGLILNPMERARVQLIHNPSKP